MPPLRNHDDMNSHKPCADAFAYEDDVTKEAVDEIRKRAVEVLKKGKWKLVEGHANAK